MSLSLLNAIQPRVLGGGAEISVFQTVGHVLHELGLGRLVLLGGAHLEVHLRASLGPRGLRDGELRDGVLIGRAEKHRVSVLGGLS